VIRTSIDGNLHSGMVNTQVPGNGEWALLEVHVPGRKPEPAGILLRDVKDRLHVRLRSEWSNILPDEDAKQIWQELADDLEQKAREMGSAEILDWLETTASHTLQISPRRVVRVLDVASTLDSLFRQNVCASGGPGLKSPVLTRQRKSYSSLHSRLRVAAIAATLVLGILLSHGPSHPITKAVSKPELNPPHTKADQSIVLPISSGLAYEPELLNIDWQTRPTKRCNRQVHRVIQHRHKRFNAQYLALHRPARVHQMPLPSLYTAVAASSTAPLNTPSPLLTTLPEPPKFKQRRNRFLHVFAVIATPLRLLAAR